MGPRNNQWRSTRFDVDRARSMEVDIDWNGTPWEGDIFEDDEDMKDISRAIFTLNQAFTVSNRL
jgi:hypothetical protein